MNKYFEEARAMQDSLVAMRRDLHMHPETGFTEFRTASKIVKELQALGYEVFYGDDCVVESEMFGVPSSVILENHMQRAIDEGADPEIVKKMAGGKTGIMAVMHFAKPGKTVAFRYDMDCNDVVESTDANHRPFAEGFASLHKGEMHACGHDGHVTIGLALAKLIANNKEDMAGTIKIIFQPAEEGVRGARAMAVKGLVDDVDFMFGGHIGFKATVDNSLICASGGLLATTKLDAHFTGRSAHAGAAPQDGRNALLAAAQAAISLHSISRHGKGASRINVGVLNAGTGRNVLPNVADMKLETRGANTEINNFMSSEANRMLKACADLYNVEVKITPAGSAPACVTELDFAKEIAAIAKDAYEFDEVVDTVDFGGSEDCSYFMETVQLKGGHAAYMGYGTHIAAGHHNDHFDFNEDVLWKSAAFGATLAKEYTNK
ncbi:MAG: amidohydrolase [Phascolarctobacterium sp.]|nr:amidohydrolase [Phascolarctobacterium sp.]